MSVTLEQIRRRIEVKEDGELQQFATELFGKSAPDFMDAFGADGLLAIATAGLEQVRQLGPGEVCVRVYNPTLAQDGFEAPYTVLEVLLRDRPFIVDSVRAELRRRGFELFYLLHPILHTVRDADGRLLELATSAQAEAEREAYELYFVEREDDLGALRALEDAVREVLRDVLLATGDYVAMCDQAEQTRAYLANLRAQRVQGADARAQDTDTPETQDRVQGVVHDRREELDEYAAFMRWLEEDNYVFLGYREYDIITRDGAPHLLLTPNSGLGILSKLETSAYTEPVPVSELPEGLRERVTGGRVLTVTKTNAESTVHRPARMDYIGVKKLRDAQVVGEIRFVGLFTSKALSTAVEDIPILRLKLRRVLAKDRAVPGSHDFKQITAIFNSMPREELFWADADQLYQDIRAIMGLEQERGVRLTLRPDPLGRGLAAMVVMPRDRFNATVRRAIQGFLYEQLAATHVDYQLAMGEDESQLRFHFFFTTEKSHFDVDVNALERAVAELTRTWDDHLLERLTASKGETRGRRLAEKYSGAFDEAYKADTSTTAALRDIEQLEALGTEAYRVDILNAAEEGQDSTRSGDTTLVKIYHGERTLTLSSVMPMLENLGFRVLEQIAYHARLADGKASSVRGVDIFRVQDWDGATIDVPEHGERLVEALTLLLSGRAESDRLNRLVLYGGLEVRQVALLRAYQMYYAQLNAVTSRSFINETLLNHPKLAAILYAAFAAKFNPAFDGDRESAFESLKSEFLDALNNVASLPEDTTLRGLFNLVDSSVRSNFFLNRSVISFKLESKKVSSMPEPRPLYEIAVSGLGVEGAHLRGGKVARGGIRWSDRPDDFRTEVLGLMKTQMTKNAVIVPVGSKGGFVLKNAPLERDALRAYGREQYRLFISGLLDLTDNLVNGQTVHPQEVLIYDEPDPYLVVAADKGTATFSDLANEVAAEYEFWLGDAFASGGSYGYDHKREGITARGAWECVARHFREMGVDVHEDTFSVVGIGDMSGDVFGNGLIYTDKLKLLAAFNHLHIFLDPDPDPATSFEERKRLFELPRSTWQDYDPELVSEGGGVFERGAKSIALSPQVKEMLGVEADALSGQALIQAILKAPADLLWNGGIGTYVKSSLETDAEVGDSSNDLVRVDADALNAKVVGEGGNLGFTQLARVEYARGGGRINTDAIDNSAGVDMSDHEVNIKILLQPLLPNELSFDERNLLLEEMTAEVNALVLKDNYYQSLALSLAQRRSLGDPLLFESLADYLQERGALNPAVEFLPGRKELLERQKVGESYTRPELAILLAYTKMGMYRRLLETDFPDEPYFQHYLFAYFPSQLAKHYPSAIKTHQLRREIIATQFTNTVVDVLGITFVHRSLRDTGAKPVEVIRAALIALELLDVQRLVTHINALDNVVPTEVQYRAFDELVKAVEGVVTWILLSDQQATSVAEFVGSYRDPLQKLRGGLGKFLSTVERERFTASARSWSKQGLPKDLAKSVAGLDYLPSSVGIIEVSGGLDLPVAEVAPVFFEVGERLSLGWLRDRLTELPSPSKWDKVARGGLVMDLRQTQRKLSRHFLEARAHRANSNLDDFLTREPRALSRYDTALAEVRATETFTLASAGVLARLLARLVEGINGG